MHGVALCLDAKDEDVIHVDSHNPSLMSSLKMSFIIIWKLPDLLVRLKNMTKGSNKPLFIWKVASHSSPLDPYVVVAQWMSNLIKYRALASDTLLRMSRIRGSVTICSQR